MKSRPVTDSSFLIGGAILGAAAMYFLDPDVGNRRRRRVASAAEGAYDHARDAVGDRLHNLSTLVKDLAHNVVNQVDSVRHGDNSQALADEARRIANQLTEQAIGSVRGKQEAAAEHVQHASDIGHRLWERARGLGSRLGHLGDSFTGQVRDVRDDLSGRALGWRHWLSNRVSDAHSNAQALIGEEPPRRGIGAGGVMSTAVGCCAVGAGVMYFMDPSRGQKRRAWVWDQASGAVCSAGRLMRATGNDLANRFPMFQARNERHWIDSRELINDIRARIGGWIANPNDVQFLVDADGSVTVTGKTARDEMDRLLSRLHDVPGVSHVINRLTIRELAASQNSPNSPIAAQT